MKKIKKTKKKESESGEPGQAGESSELSKMRIRKRNQMENTLTGTRKKAGNKGNK
jgi:hypothetical protein